MLGTPVWTCRDPIYLILGTRFSILGTRIGSLEHFKKTLNMQCKQMRTFLKVFAYGNKFIFF